MKRTPFKVRMLFWSVFAGSRSPMNRIKIISQLRKKPLNTNQLANKLKLDYKVVQRHLNALDKNCLLTKVGTKYGAMYYLSSLMKSNIEVFDEIIANLEIRK